MKSVLRWCVVPLLAGTLVAQTAAKPRAKKAAAKPAQPAVTLQDLQSLKDALAAQQQQIEQLKQEPPATHRPRLLPLKPRPTVKRKRSSSWTATWLT